MTKLILPHTIDAGTDVTAVEHQDNYVAIRDNMNGLLEGGDPAVNGNMMANGITYRELAHNLMKYHTRGPIKQEGVFDESELKVSPSANLTLAVAAGEAMITDDSAVVFDVGMKVPVKYAGGTVTLDAAHATLPRVDQIVARVTDYETCTIEKLTGTATAGAQINAAKTTATYRLGAAALGNDRILLADVIVVATDTVIVAADINDRRPWCRGMQVFTVAGTGLSVYSDLDGNADLGYEIDLWGLLTGTTADPTLHMNGDTAAGYYGRVHYHSNVPNDASSAYTGFVGYKVFAYYDNTAHVVQAEMKIMAKAQGSHRLLNGHHQTIRSSDSANTAYNQLGAWNNVADNVRSMHFVFNGTYTGPVVIRKMLVA